MSSQPSISFAGFLFSSQVLLTLLSFLKPLDISQSLIPPSTIFLEHFSLIFGSRRKKKEQETLTKLIPWFRTWEKVKFYMIFMITYKYQGYLPWIPEITDYYHILHRHSTLTQINLFPFLRWVMSGKVKSFVWGSHYRVSAKKKMSNKINPTPETENFISPKQENWEMDPNAPKMYTHGSLFTWAVLIFQPGYTESEFLMPETVTHPIVSLEGLEFPPLIDVLNPEYQSVRCKWGNTSTRGQVLLKP